MHGHVACAHSYLQPCPPTPLEYQSYMMSWRTCIHGAPFDMVIGRAHMHASEPRNEHGPRSACCVNMKAVKDIILYIYATHAWDVYAGQLHRKPVTTKS